MGVEEVQSSSLPVYLCEEEASKDYEVFKNVTKKQLLVLKNQPQTKQFLFQPLACV